MRKEKLPPTFWCWILFVWGVFPCIGFGSYYKRVAEKEARIEILAPYMEEAPDPKSDTHWQWQGIAVGKTVNGLVLVDITNDGVGDFPAESTLPVQVGDILTGTEGFMGKIQFKVTEIIPTPASTQQGFYLTILVLIFYKYMVF